MKKSNFFLVIGFVSILKLGYWWVKCIEFFGWVEGIFYRVSIFLGDGCIFEVGVML